MTSDDVQRLFEQLRSPSRTDKKYRIEFKYFPTGATSKREFKVLTGDAGLIVAGALSMRGIIYILSIEALIW